MIAATTQTACGSFAASKYGLPLPSCTALQGCCCHFGCSQSCCVRQLRLFSNSANWVVQDHYCPQGSGIKSGFQLRLQHAATRKFLHSHHFESPLSGQQEVSTAAVPASCSQTQQNGGCILSACVHLHPVLGMAMQYYPMTIVKCFDLSWIVM